MSRLRHLSSSLLAVAFMLTLLMTGCAQATPTTQPATAAQAPTLAPATVLTVAPPSAPSTAPQAVPTTAPAPAGSALSKVDATKVTGSIITAGSSTVFPLSEAIAEQFRDEGFAGDLTIDSIGSGAGFERFCKTGDIDIANASRAIKESEVASCQAIGRTPVEFRVGTDALALAVSKDNTFLRNVTIEQLGQIFTFSAVKWSDVNPAWPNEDIKRFSPGTDSGTFDYFVEVVLGKDKNRLLSAGNLQLSEDDNVLVQGVEGSPYAIGYFGYAYYQENAGKLQVLSVEGVAPSAESVDAGTYKLARPLFLYSDAKIMADKPQVASFISYYLTNVNDVIGKVGYFPASDVVLNESRATWLGAVK